LAKILFFTHGELATIIAIGLVTGLIDDRAEMLEFALVARINPLVLFDFYLAHVAGGPILGDLLITWLEYGAVLAACVVRKPAAGTIALTVNGAVQVFAHGTHDPHLLYGAAGLGADLVFAAFSFRRYDVRSILLAGAACGVFWYPIVWFTHGVYLYPPLFIVSDFVVRVGGSALGDGLIGAALAFVLLGLGGRTWDRAPPLTLGDVYGTSSLAEPLGLLAVAVGLLLIVLTYAVPAVSNFFLSIGPHLPAGVPALEEYNPGYVLGVDVVFVVVVVLAFWHSRTRYTAQL